MNWDCWDDLINSRNHLHFPAHLRVRTDPRHMGQQLYQISRLAALIREKQVEQERLQAQYNSLLQLEASQKDFIEQFILQK